jgi:stress-induced morphogen
MVETSVLEQRLREKLTGVTHVDVKDMTGTKDHFEAVIVASAFEGQSRIKQHQLVYGALGELMDGPVHALTFKTFTPDAWAQQGG